MRPSSDPIHAGHSALTPSQHRTNFWYIVPTLVLPFLMLMAAFFVVPTDWFEMHSGNSYLVSLGYANVLHNRRCDILVYGDSTALIGINPTILQQRTGLSACNIAEPLALNLVYHTQLVDDFLAHNPRPQFIVFLYVPSSLNEPQRWPKDAPSFEGISYLLRHRSPIQAALALAPHPVETLTWAEIGIRLTLSHLRSQPYPESKRHIRDATDGRLVMPETTRTSCGPATSAYRIPPDPKWIAEIRTHYGQAGTQVIIDATPTAPCDPDLPYFQQHVNDFVDNRPYTTIPLEDFSTDGHLHVNQQGIGILSNMVADQVLALQKPSRGN